MKKRSLRVRNYSVSPGEQVEHPYVMCSTMIRGDPKGYRRYLIQGTEAKAFHPSDEAIREMLETLAPAIVFVKCERIRPKKPGRGMSARDLLTVLVPIGDRNILSYHARRKPGSPGWQLMQALGGALSAIPIVQLYGERRHDEPSS